MTIEQMHDEIAAYCKGFKRCTDGCRLRNDNAESCRWDYIDDTNTGDCYGFLIAEGLIGKPEQPMSKEELTSKLREYCDSFGKECDGCKIESVNMGCDFERKSYADLKRLYDIAYPKEINFVKVERNDEVEQTNDAVNRKAILETAEKYVCNDRNNQYGSPEDSFKVIADLWAGYLGTKITAKDVAAMMVLLKMARVRTGAGKADNWIDAAGYCACGGEIEAVENEQA